jgi:hypothetical protein
LKGNSILFPSFEQEMLMEAECKAVLHGAEFTVIAVKMAVLG